MRIRPSPRVVYTNNPLAEVVCQVRFDRVLQLQNAAPAALQRELRPEYPTLSVEEHASLQLVLGEGPPIGPSGESTAIPSIYHFASADGINKVSVSADFLSLTCHRYVGWDDFKVRFETGLDVFHRIYAPTPIRRLGLRYKDLISREILGLEGMPWSHLLSPFVTGLFGAVELFETSLSTAVEDRIQHSSQSTVRLDDCNVLLQCALLNSTDAPPRQAFLIDSDFFHESASSELTPNTLSTELELLHKNAGALFRACIKEPLHDALGPS